MPTETDTHHLPATLDAGTALPARHLQETAAKARGYAKAARAENTRRAYDADWRLFVNWLRRQGLAELPPNPEVIGLYLTSLVSPSNRTQKPVKVSTLERRLSGISWHYRQIGQPLDLSDRHIATVLAGIRRQHGSPPVQKEAVLGPDLIAMLAVLGNDLRGLRDRAILAIGFAGGLRRSEIVGLDCGQGQTQDGTGWIEIIEPAGQKEGGLLLTVKGKTGWRKVEVGRGSRPATCPVAILETWMRLGRICHGPLFRRISMRKGGAGADRLDDKHVARLVKRVALAAGVRPDLPEGKRKAAFAGHSLRAGLASSAEADEALVQRQLGHASPQMTRRYQRRRDLFRVNLTKAAGL